MPGNDLLFVTMDIDPAREREFNKWYDEEHIPEMQTVPGILKAGRYRALHGQPRYLALYDLEDVEVLESPEYLKIAAWSPEASPRSREMFASFLHVTRGVYRQLFSHPAPEPKDASQSRAMLVRGVEVLPEREEEFLEWDDTEHLPNLRRVPGVLRARRYKLHTQATGLIGRPFTFLTRYDLANTEVQASADWRRALDSPWSRRIRRFYTSPLRNVYERITP